MSGDAIGPEHSIEDVARILRVPASAIRQLVEPGCSRLDSRLEEARFSFQDLVVLRAAQKLRQAKVPVRRIRSALRGLGRSVPRGHSMTALHITACGGAVVAHDGETAWHPESGQMLFDFAVSDPARPTGASVHRRVTAWERAGELDADDWFALGCDREADGAEDCVEAYLRALELDPGHFDANLNLGRCLHERGELEEAVRCYRRAMEARPGEALAAFNLGVAMEDLARPVEAMAAYELAVQADPECADAHFNVARLYEAEGETAEAVQHLQAYRRLSRRQC